MKKIIGVIALFVSVPLLMAASGVGISAWTAVTEALTDSDFFAVTDVSDTSGSDTGTNKKATGTQVKTYILSGLSAASVAITDVGTYFTGTNLETVLQEVGADLAAKLEIADVVTVSANIATFMGADDYAEMRSFLGVLTKYLSGTEADFYGTLLDPQAIYAVDGTNHAVTLINKTPAAFTITEISVSCDADPTTELTLTLQHKAAGIGYGTPTTIEAVTTVNGTITITTGIDDPTIPVDTKVFATLSDPDDALNECSWQIEGDWD